MKWNRLTLGSLILALNTTSLFAQDLQKIMPPKPMDAETMAARRAVVLNRLAKAPSANKELAQGTPGVPKGVESGGQAGEIRTAIAASKVRTVNGPVGAGAAVIVGTPPAIK